MMMTFYLTFSSKLQNKNKQVVINILMSMLQENYLIHTYIYLGNLLTFRKKYMVRQMDSLYKHRPVMHNTLRCYQAWILCYSSKLQKTTCCTVYNITVSIFTFRSCLELFAIITQQIRCLVTFVRPYEMRQLLWLVSGAFLDLCTEAHKSFVEISQEVDVLVLFGGGTTAVRNSVYGT